MTQRTLAEHLLTMARHERTRRRWLAADLTRTAERLLGTHQTRARRVEVARRWAQEERAANRDAHRFGG
jgi:hypothetical protein